MVKDFLALLNQGKVPRGPEILAASDPGFVARVEQASRLEWFPAAPVVKLADTARTLMGAARWRSVHCAVAGELAQRPLFRAFAEGMRSVFGATPAAYCRIFPMVLQQAHRNCGSIEYASIDRTAAQVRFTQCPVESLSQGMLEVFAGTLEGLVSPVTHGVRVEVEYAPGADSAILWVRWGR